MNLLFWGLTLGMVGKVLLAIGVIMAHTEIAHEKRIDAEVIRSFKTELIITLLGVIFIVAGYFMELYFYGFTPLLGCSGTECAAMINAAFSQ